MASDKFITKDSGKRVLFASGFNRDVNDGKPRYDLIPLPMLTRLAGLYQRGAVKYGDSNWMKAETEPEINRFKESAWRHFIQYMSGDVDEDHMSAVCFNLFAYETLKYKIEKKDGTEQKNSNDGQQSCSGMVL